MSDLATLRLIQERKEFTKQRPFGFYAKPQRKSDGSTNLFLWECSFIPDPKSIYAIPGNEVGYRVLLHFPPEYPIKAPRAQFDPPIFHCNVFTNGNVCLSILLEDGHHGGRVQSHWTPDITVSKILLSLRQFLDEENPNSVANPEACKLYLENLAKYKEKVRQEAAKYEIRLQAHLGKDITIDLSPPTTTTTTTTTTTDNNNKLKSPNRTNNNKGKKSPK